VLGFNVNKQTNKQINKLIKMTENIYQNDHTCKLTLNDEKYISFVQEPRLCHAIEQKVILQVAKALGVSENQQSIVRYKPTSKVSVGIYMLVCIA